MLLMLAGLTQLPREQRSVYVRPVSLANVNMSSSRLVVTICTNCSNVQGKRFCFTYCTQAVYDYFPCT